MRLLNLVISLFFGVQVQALEVPPSIALGNSDFTTRTLNSACFGMDTLVDGLPCNPAFIAKERKSRFQTQFFIGNNISYIREISRLLDGDGDAETVEKLFRQKTSAEAEANIQSSYVRETWGVQYSPLRLYYYTLIRNSALPIITLHAGQEQSLAGQIASYAEGNLYWGLQLRAVDRRFLLSEFTLTDALASGGSQYFETKTQRALYVEPGILYAWEDREWKPQFGLTMKNAGIVDEKYDELSTNPQWHLAGSVRPPVGWGILELGVDLHFHSYIEEAKDLPRFGFSYKLGFVQTLASIADREASLGILFQFENWNGGLTYWQKRYENLFGEEDESNTLYLLTAFTF